MREQTITKNKKGLSEVIPEKATKSVISYILYAVAGFMLSGGAVFGSYAPFGASWVASVPFNKMIATIIGSVAGYIIITPDSSFRYIATVIAIGAIRWTLSDLKRLTKSVAYPVIVSSVPMLATGLVLVVVGGFRLNLVVMAVIEALLSGVGAYFYFKAINIIRTT